MRKIVFMTGTRADFGKLKSLIEVLIKLESFEVYIFATGMHMDARYDLTVQEIVKCGYKNIYKFNNHTDESSMDVTLAKTVSGFSNYIQNIKPDLIVVHGDRLEAMSGAIVGSFNNILVAHIEGGEISGTLDEIIRHSVSKLSHVHFVSNDDAKRRLVQMGEEQNSIYVIGSPDVDKMLSNDLPLIEDVKHHYGIEFEKYAVLLFHPVTTEIDDLAQNCSNLIAALNQLKNNFIVIYPNNDRGSSIILNAYQALENNPRFKIFPSIRFENFLTLLKNTEFILGNSSAGIRETPYYSIPSINIGSRQNKRATACSITNVDYSTSAIVNAVKELHNCTVPSTSHYGEGKSAELFLSHLTDESFWLRSKQKSFIELGSYV